MCMTMGNDKFKTVYLTGMEEGGSRKEEEQDW